MNEAEALQEAIRMFGEAAEGYELEAKAEGDKIAVAQVDKNNPAERFVFVKYDSSTGVQVDPPLPDPNEFSRPGNLRRF